ncbi:MAG TPA: FAD-dependent thymidylate synthase [bacterium]
MKAVLLNYTPDPEKAVAVAAKLCYSSSDIAKLKSKLEPPQVEKLLRKIVRMGHHSVLEHANFSFGVEGISRAASHQLVRHRLASYSQQSQRYVVFKDNVNFITPPSVSGNPGAKKIFERCLESSFRTYRELMQIGIPAEDARFVLPNASETRIIVTMNARELHHFFRLRGCRRAQWEIRSLAMEMQRLVKQVAPLLFERAGPGCLTGGCTEGEFYCGDLDGVREEFAELSRNSYGAKVL